MMATQAERREATIGAIDQAARRLFETCGFAETTVDDIVSQAGVAKGAFYHHYESKESVFTKVLEQIQLGLAREIAAVASKGASPVAKLRLGLRAYIGACERSSVRQVLLLDGPTVLGWMRWREIDDKYFGEMTRQTVAAALGPDASAIHVRAVTALISGAFAEAAMVSAANSTPKFKSKDVAVAMDLLLKGLESTAEKSAPRRPGTTGLKRRPIP
jgi:AcrR family transcriptional regulator